ncbi:dATP pyrophosphohydrolase [Aestuariivirga sp.]|jgi:hypothetical protein|uniref:dATP pyrophosphohydrolase n=1 Tax=Aestuariivirga sp. TaxID=2650926 RepID=UPI0037831E9A
MTQPISVRPVSGKADLKAFLDLPFGLYRRDPHWVAPLYLERLEHLDPRKNPYFRHAEVALFLAFRGERPVGRITAQACRLRAERFADGTGQFGFLEAEDDPAVFAALFEAASSWLAARGLSRMQGPFNFSINDEMGLLVEGFDTPPSMMMGHALPYYATRLEELGFAKAKDVIAYDFEDPGHIPRTLKAAYDRALANPDIRVRPLDKKQLMSELEIIVAIANDAWSENWGFVPWTQEEMTALGNNLKLLVTGDYIAIAEYKGEPAAMAVSLPNINDWIRGLDGRLLPFGWAKLAWNLMARPPRSVRMPLMGVRKAFHGTAMGGVLGMAALARVRSYHVSRGTMRGELSWILEDNMRMRRMIETFGGKAYKTYRIYEKATGGG